MTDSKASGHIGPTWEGMAALRVLPAERPIAMINLLRFRAQAAYPEDHPSAAFGTSGAEAYAAYRRAAASPFRRAGGTQVWFGASELTVIGPGEEVWDLGFIAHDPSNETFAAMLRDPEYQAAVVHRQAAVADCRLIWCALRPTNAGVNASIGL